MNIMRKGGIEEEEIEEFMGKKIRREENEDEIKEKGMME